MKFTYAVINADATSSLQLQHHLGQYTDFQCAALTTNSADGLNAILKFSPDIVFIGLNEGANGYFQMSKELYQYLNNIPLLIGTSKTKTHAYDAIKNGFFDYWLLPYDEFDIRKSMLRLKKQLPKEEKPQTVCLQSYSDFQYLKTDDILYLEADNNTTDFVMKDGTVYHAYKTLKTFVGQMPDYFVRIHQSYMVNTNYVSHISYGKALCSLKLRKLQLPFSKSYRQNIDQLKQLLTKNTISFLNWPDSHKPELYSYRTTLNTLTGK